MSKPVKLWISWGCLYLLCTACGFISAPQGALEGLFFLFSVGFFIPGGMLLYHGIKNRQHSIVKSVRLISILSLSLTLLFIVLNFATARDSSVVGAVMYAFLIIVSSPMICSQVWLVSLFGWACLLMGSLPIFQKK